MQVEVVNLLAGEELMLNEGNIRLYGSPDGVLDVLSAYDSSLHATFRIGGWIHVIECTEHSTEEIQKGNFDWSAMRKEITDLYLYLHARFPEMHIVGSLGTGAFIGGMG